MIKNLSGKKILFDKFSGYLNTRIHLKKKNSHMIRKILIDLTCRQFKSS